MNVHSRGDETTGDVPVNSDRSIKVNWGTFNVPTIAGMFVVFAAVWNLSQTLAQLRFSLDAIEKSREQRYTETNSRLTNLEGKFSAIDNVMYRVTVAEQGIQAANARIDRMADALGDIRDDIAKTTTAIEVLTEKLEAAVPGINNRGK